MDSDSVEFKAELGDHSSGRLVRGLVDADDPVELECLESPLDTSCSGLGGITRPLNADPRRQPTSIARTVLLIGIGPRRPTP